VAKSWNRTETWLTLGVLAVGGVVAGIAGLWIYVSATATPLHPDPRAVSSVPESAPRSEWAAAADRARESIRTALAEQNLPGVSVAVGTGGDIVWAEGFGFADIEKRAAVTPATWFRLGTASTLLTSAAAGMLVEQGALKLDDEIQTYVPEFPKKEWPVTLRQIMGHVAGLRNDGGDESVLFSQHCDRPVEAIGHFADADLRFEPGTQFRYSNYGFIVVSAAIESAAGDGFLTYMRKHVFEPLGMNDTTADLAAEAIPERATPYFPRFAADPRYGYHPMRPLDLSCYSGAGIFQSTASDMVRFGLALNTGKLLRPETVQLLQTSLRLPSGEPTGYGLGWDLENVIVAGKPTQTVGEDGAVLGGTAVSILTFREPALVIAVLSNTSYADTAAIALKIAEAFAQAAGSR
jgi:CubicO group peptidase (beta-lactamase class C family)